MGLFIILNIVFGSCLFSLLFVCLLISYVMSPAKRIPSTLCFQRVFFALLKAAHCESFSFIDIMPCLLITNVLCVMGTAWGHLTSLKKRETMLVDKDRHSLAKTLNRITLLQSINCFPTGKGQMHLSTHIVND